MALNVKWVVKLKQPSENEEDWKSILEALPVIVSEEDGEVYFSLDQFEQAADVHEVKEKVEEFILRINRGLSAAPIKKVDFEIDGYFEIVEDDGETWKREAVIPEFLEGGGRVFAPTIASSSHERRVEVSRSYALSALEDDIVNDILTLLEEEPTPATLYNIYEGIVEKDMGEGNKRAGIEKVDQLGWVVKDELNNFQHSVQVREVVGLQARHFFADWEPPESPMSFSEMESFIRRLSGRWLNYKTTRKENS